MKVYGVDEVFEILCENKITTNKESVRRWLRQGVIKGIPPASRKEGWKIREKDLNEFLKDRLPQTITTKVVKESSEAKEKFAKLGAKTKLLLDFHEMNPVRYDAEKILNELIEFQKRIEQGLE